MDNEYEFKYNDKRPVDFNPLLTVKSDIGLNVPQDVKDRITEELNNTKSSFSRKKVVDRIKEEGIDIIDNRKYIRDAERQCVNSVIQGSAADITKIAMIRLGTNEELKRLGFQMKFPVHDEVIAECPFENRKRCAELMSQIMIDSAKAKINVPMKCDTELFFYWYGPDVDVDDDAGTLAQYEDFITTGSYKDKNEYKV